MVEEDKIRRVFGILPEAVRIALCSKEKIVAIKCVVVDLGGVCVGIDRKFIAREYAPYSEYSEAELYAMLMHQAPDNGLWEAVDWFDEGKDLECSDYDFYLRMAAALKLDTAKLDFFQFRRIYSGFIYVIPEMVDLLKRLRNVRLGIISNLCRIHQSMIFNFIPRELFDFTIFSYVEQVMKPKPEIYERACRAAGVWPFEMIFHDDKMENLEAAAKLGIYACLHDPGRPAAVNVQIAEAVMRSLKVSIF